VCPRCRESMLRFELDGVEIDRCDRCEGTWLDSGELVVLIERRGSGGDHLRDAIRAGPWVGKTRLRCVRCRRRLHEVYLSRDPEIVVDCCPGGHGVWCDRGEMSMILERFSTRSVIADHLGQVYAACRDA